MLDENKGKSKEELKEAYKKILKDLDEEISKKQKEVYEAFVEGLKDTPLKDIDELALQASSLMMIKKIYEKLIKAKDVGNKAIIYQQGLDKVNAKLSELESKLDNLEKDNSNIEKKETVKKKVQEYKELSYARNQLTFYLKPDDEIQNFEESIKGAIEISKLLVDINQKISDKFIEVIKPILDSEDPKKVIEDLISAEKEKQVMLQGELSKLELGKLNPSSIPQDKKEEYIQNVTKLASDLSASRAIIRKLEKVLHPSDPAQRVDVTSPALKLLEKRAEYNLSKYKDPSIFNEYLPYRRSIQNDKEKLEQYERLVDKIISNTDMSFTKRVINSRVSSVVVLNESQLDASSKYLMAALFVELFHNREDDINKLTSGDNEEDKFKLILTPKIYSNENVAGLFRGDENTIFIECEPFLNDFLDGTNCTVIHEGVHKIEAKGVGFKCDGILDDMESIKDDDGISLLEKFKDAYDELSAKYENHRENLSEDEIKKINKKSIDPATGLTNYSFATNVEFLAETISIFSRNPNMLKKASEKLYKVYVDYFGFDPLELRQNKEEEENKKERSLPKAA